MTNPLPHKIITRCDITASKPHSAFPPFLSVFWRVSDQKWRILSLKVHTKFPLFLVQILGIHWLVDLCRLRSIDKWINYGGFSSYFVSLPNVNARCCLQCLERLWSGGWLIRAFFFSFFLFLHLQQIGKKPFKCSSSRSIEDFYHSFDQVDNGLF